MLVRKFFTYNLYVILSVFTFTPEAQAQSGGQPDALKAIYLCKSITDSEKRLACYDNSIGRLEASEKNGEVVTVSKAAIQTLERDAFGFDIPSLPVLNKLFGGPKPAKVKNAKENPLSSPIKTKPKKPKAVKTAKPPQDSTKLGKTPILKNPKSATIKKVELTIRKASQFGRNKTRFFFENGQVWEQIESIKIRVPKSSNERKNKVVIRKNAVGSFFLRINGKGAAIRVRRVR